MYDLYVIMNYLIEDYCIKIKDKHNGLGCKIYPLKERLNINNLQEFNNLIKI